MITATSATSPQSSAGGRLLACVAKRGSGSNPYFASADLLTGPDSNRNLADAVHFLCAVHGRYPGVVDLAATRSAGAQPWLGRTARAFSAERAFVARLAVEAGPLPPTPGAAGAEGALLSQRRALDMLAQSEREGCALGAALALIADWGRIRLVLNTAASRFGTAAPTSQLIDEDAIAAIADEAGASPLVERAMLFGAEQIMLQHHGLWDLLEARQLARSAR